MKKRALAAVAAVLTVSTWMGAGAQTATSQTPTMDHGSSHQGTGPAGDGGPSSLAFEGANARMHADMAIEYTGDADVDFVRGMIPHHQGAIDMARIVIEFGQDPQIRKLAGEIIAAQESEIAMMREWLKARGY